MVRLGRINKLTVKAIRNFGALLDGGEDGDVLLPPGELPDPCQPGDEVVVLVYLDGQDQYRATTRRPLITVGRFAALRVVATTASGAYLDWGAPRDLFVPLSEQQVKMAVGQVPVVFALIDEKNQRIMASSKLAKFLDQRSADYAEGEEVALLIYAQTELGYKAVINQAHGGLLHKNEVFRPLNNGDALTGYVKKHRPDGKIDLSLQPAGYQGIDAVAQAILATLQEHGGRIGVTDKSPPAEIYARFGVSKKSFKKAIGSLYQQRLILIESEGISLAG